MEKRLDDGSSNAKHFKINSCAVANTFRSSDDVDTLSGTYSSLNISCAVGSGDYNVCSFVKLANLNI